MKAGDFFKSNVSSLIFAINGVFTQKSPVHFAHTAPYAGVISLTVLPGSHVTVSVLVVLNVSTSGRAEHIYGDFELAAPKAPGMRIGWQPGEQEASLALTVEKGPQSGIAEVR